MRMILKVLFYENLVSNGANYLSIISMLNNKFSFGKNWSKYLNIHYNEKRVKSAINSIKEFTRLENLKNKSFMDIGCGSGLFSLAAYKLGAKKILSFDIDSFSVRCCEELKKKEKNSKNWKILHGSILDKDFVSRLSKYDIVYGWGVLHHTGNMWKSIHIASSLVKEGGYFYIAIYNKDKKLFGSKFWLKFKKVYYFSPSLIQELMRIGYIGVWVIYNILRFKNPVQKIKKYNLRGMSWIIDINDWLGGYPYEYATVEEISRFCYKLGFEMINIKSANNLSNNEFLFRKIKEKID